jgi:porphobilinogen synthase
MVRRPRRLRKSGAIRNLVRETTLHVSDLIYPLFVVEGKQIKCEIPSLPDVYHFSVDQLEAEIKELEALGIEHVLLFGVPHDGDKDEFGTVAHHPDGIIQRAIRQIKQVAPEICVITDVCLCEYTSHGHCGFLTGDKKIDNDSSLEAIAKVAVSHAVAGADMVAPSDMMDGRIAVMRMMLDEAGYSDVGIMSYSVKYASNYYGPFREAAGCAPSFGDRKTYQMDYANSNEALVEVELDVAEGADILMVKPALAYLDIIQRVKANTNLPLAAYNVSGEYAMLKMAVQQGIIAEEVIMETIIGMKRAGADIIITYFAKELAKQLKEQG